MVRQVDHDGRIVHLGGSAPLPPPIPSSNPSPGLRGLGDAVARVTQALGIPSCSPCVQRQERLNQLWPFQAPRS